MASSVVSQGAIPHPRSSLTGLGACVSLNVLLCRQLPCLLGSQGLAEGRAPHVSAVSTFSTETLSQTVMVERTQFLGNIPQAAGSGVTPKGPPGVLQATGRCCSCWSRWA